MDDDFDDQHYILTDQLNVQVQTDRNFYLLTIEKPKTVEQAEKWARKWVAKNCKGEAFVEMKTISTTTDND